MSNVSNLTSFKAIRGIYALVDPRTDRIMYVGQSIDIDKRYRSHLDTDRYEPNVPKRRWIKELTKAGMKPQLIVLEECGFAELDEAERRILSSLKAEGSAELNLAPGGAGNRSVSKLSNSHPDDWFQLGLKVKRARGLILSIIEDSARLGGKSHAVAWRKVLSGIDGAKAKLEGILQLTFPLWQDSGRVFYGPGPDEEQDRC
jgi:hypothetical protein